MSAGEATNERNLQSDGKYLLEMEYYGNLVLKWSDGKYLSEVELLWQMSAGEATHEINELIGEVMEVTFLDALASLERDVGVTNP